MVNTWIRATLNKYCEITSSKRIFAADYQANGVPFYRGKEITEKHKGSLDVSTEIFISRSKFFEIKNKFGAPQPGDLLLTSVGTLGMPYVVKQGEEFYFKDGNLTWFRNFKGLDSRFLYFWILSPQGKGELKKATIGSSQSAYTIVLLKGMEVNLPPLETQRKIASILSAYDDLIENNTRRIKILEEMAQTIYREWFVNFRFPGHEKVKMVDSPLGKIPEGWEVVKLGSIAKVNAKSIRKGDSPNIINYIDISSVSTGSIDKVEEVAFSEAPSRARRIVQHGDVIWATVRPNRKSYSLILKPMDDLIVSTGFAVLSPVRVPFTYLYHAITTEDFASYLVNNATGAAYPAVNAGDFKNADLLLPSGVLLTRFHESTEGLFILKENLKLKNGNLRQARDLLLPKLISGAIDVSALEIETKETAA